MEYSKEQIKKALATLAMLESQEGDKIENNERLLWVHHATLDSKVIDVSDIEQATKDGFFDSPTKAKDAEKNTNTKKG